MNYTRIIELWRLIPEPNTYTGQVKLADLPPIKRAELRPEARAKALNDPAFGWEFIRAHLDAEKPLPQIITEPELTRTYNFYAQRTEDQAVVEAFSLQTPEETRRRVLAQCGLLCPQYTIASVAKAAQMP